MATLTSPIERPRSAVEFLAWVLLTGAALCLAFFIIALLPGADGGPLSLVLPFVLAVAICAVPVVYELAVLRWSFPVGVGVTGLFIAAFSIACGAVIAQLDGAWLTEPVIEPGWILMVAISAGVAGTLLVLWSGKRRAPSPAPRVLGDDERERLAPRRPGAMAGRQALLFSAIALFPGYRLVHELITSGAQWTTETTLNLIWLTLVLLIAAHYWSQCVRQRRAEPPPRG